MAGADRAVPRRRVAGAAGTDILSRVTDNVVELALIGAGRMGRMHLRALETLREGGRRRSA